MMQYNQPQLGVRPNQAINHRNQGGYSPSIGPGDVISLYGSRRPARTGGRIAAREGIKYGVSGLGDTFYQNGHFTGLGGATTGGLIGAASGVLNGGDAGEVAGSAGIGAASGYAGNAATNYAMSQGASQAGAGALGGMAGGTVGLIGNVLVNGDENLDSAAASAVGTTIGSAVASGVGLGAYAGPIGAAVGAAIGLIKSQGAGARNGPKFYEDYTWDTGSPLVVDNGKWRAGRIKDYTGKISRGDKIPEKYQKMLVKAHQRRADYMAKFLNDIKYSGDVKHVNAFFNNMPGRKANFAKNIKDFGRGTTFLRNFDKSVFAGGSLAEKLNGLSRGSHILLDTGDIISRQALDNYNNDLANWEGASDEPLRPMFSSDYKIPVRYDGDGNEINIEEYDSGE